VGDRALRGLADPGRLRRPLTLALSPAARGRGNVGPRPAAARGVGLFTPSPRSGGKGAGVRVGPPPTSSVQIGEPFDTFAPAFTLSPRTVPASGAGTSIVAFSDSSTTSGASLATASPSLTSTSITGTSW
jgi:hypothetical protein